MSTLIKREAFGRIRRLVRGDGVHIVFQPIADLDTGAVIGFEALARFDGTPPRTTTAWFDDAAAAGLRRELELTTARAAVRALSSLPDHTYMTVNASPDVATDPAFIAAVTEGGSRIVVEITEHVPIDDYDAFNLALATLRSRGVRVAIDDAGAGFANLTHILRINPDIIKLDIELTRHVDIDARRRALVRSLVEFARSSGATLVAEGIETAAELAALRDLGVEAGQGYHLGRPAALPARFEASSIEPARRLGPSAALAIADARSFLRSRRAARRATATPRGILRPLLLAIVGTMILAPAALAVSDDAMPGSASYWLKRKIESVRLVVALDRSTETRLHLDFARRRMNELSELLADGRSDLAPMVLSDFVRHVDAVSGAFGPTNTVAPGLRKRVTDDLADYVAALGDEHAQLCKTAIPANAKGCGSTAKAIRRSAQALAHAKPKPKPKHTDPHAIGRTTTRPARPSAPAAHPSTPPKPLVHVTTHVGHTVRKLL